MSEFEKIFQDSYDMNIDDSCKYRHEASKQLAKGIWMHQQAKIDAITKQRDSFIKANHIAMNDVCEHKAKIAELQARADSLTNINESLVAYKNQLLDELEEKGNKDEN